MYDRNEFALLKSIYYLHYNNMECGNMIKMKMNHEDTIHSKKRRKLKVYKTDYS